MRCSTPSCLRTRATASATFTLKFPSYSAALFSSLDRRSLQMHGVIEPRPLLGRPAEPDRFQLAQEDASQEGDPGVGGRQVLLRAVDDYALAAHGDVVLGVLQSGLVHAGNDPLMKELVVVMHGAVVQV